MPNPQEELEKKLEALRLTYLEHLPDKVAELDALWETARHSQESEALSTVTRMAHSLAGSGATFGLQSVTDTARALENFLKILAKTEAPLSAEQQEQVVPLLGALHAAAGLTPVPPPPSSPPPGVATVAPLAGEDAPIPPYQEKVVFLVDGDTVHAEVAAIQIGYYGYDVRVFHRIGDFKAALEQQTPAAVLMDIAFPEGELAGVEAMPAIQRRFAHPLPLIFVSSRHDLKTRLEAVRAGGDAYFTKPLDFSALVDKLDTLTVVRREVVPFRVLVVEDSVPLAEFYALTLQKAGMETRTVSSPMQLLDQMERFGPELILMDMYMPDCNGQELAAVIRQDEVYVGIPIVFLSGETDVFKQLAAMRQGGDDFLTKPIQPAHLVAAVSIRAERYRSLRAFMTRDSLTGLLNHTKIKEHLSMEMARAGRQDRPMAFAMIDLDRFKSVNDTYGHSVGDRVIKSLSRLLRQRLRRSDVVGRYGGEEFAVILEDTDAANALSVLEGIREAFSQIVQSADGAEFYSTFSCGVATYPRYDTAARIGNAADKALYQAKHEGRNRIVMADG